MIKQSLKQIKIQHKIMRFMLTFQGLSIWSFFNIDILVHTVNLNYFLGEKENSRLYYVSVPYG